MRSHEGWHHTLCLGAEAGSPAARGWAPHWASDCGTGTDGTPYAYFRSAFLYRYHHDIGYADSSGKQGSQAHHPDKDAGTLPMLR